MLHCAPTAESILDQFSESEWIDFRDFFEVAFDDSRSGERLAIGSISRIKSKRARCLLAIRSSSLAMEFFLSDCADKGGEKVCGHRLRQSWTLDALIQRKMEWKTGLAIIAEAYSANVWSGAQRLRYNQLVVPIDIANDILGRPDEFPHALWELAERTASVAASKAVRAVGSVARSDHWFVA